MSNILILTGEVHSGKTTLLLQVLGQNNDAGGFLCPDIGGLRCYYNLGLKTYEPFQLEKPDEQEVISVGKFIFSKEVFARLKKLLNFPLSTDLNWFVIDEIGKLEMLGQGLEPELSQFIADFTHHSGLKPKLILVVRDYLLESVIQKYGLQHALVYNKEELGLYLRNEG